MHPNDLIESIEDMKIGFSDDPKAYDEFLHDCMTDAIRSAGLNVADLKALQKGLMDMKTRSLLTQEQYKYFFMLVGEVRMKTTMGGSSQQGGAAAEAKVWMMACCLAPGPPACLCCGACS